MLEITGDGKRAVSGGFDGTLRVWDLDSSRQLQAIDAGPPVSLGLTSYRKRALSGGGEDGALKVWDLDSGDQLCGFSAEALVGVLKWSSSARLVAGDRGGHIHIFELHSG